MTRPRLVATSLLPLALCAALALVMPRVEPAGDAAIDPDRAAGPGMDPGDWFWMQRMARDGSVPHERWVAALQQAQFERAAGALRAGAASSALVWQSVGPVNIGGRVTALAVSPAGPLYLGSANGGVFKSTDSGVNWTSITDPLPFYSIGALAMDPSNPNTVYCGTGEANSSVDSYDGTGLYRTTDAGASWASLGLATTGRIARVVVAPGDSNTVLVAAMGRQFSTSSDRGLYRSTDRGATWARTLYVSDSTGVTDVVMNPVHPDTVYCATWERVRRLTYRRTSGPESGVWRSIDRGATWTRLSAGLPTPTDSVGRIALAVSPSRPSTVYAQVTGGYSLGYAGVGFYRSLDGGATWTRRSSGGAWSSNFGGFAWYFGDIAVDPTNPDHVWSEAVSLYSSSDGGATWGSVNGGLHADQHALWVDPANSSHLYCGNDGGFWWSTTGSSWTHASTLPISQFYDGEVTLNPGATLYGGLQDNGTVMSSGGANAFFGIQGGDGFHVLADPTNPNILFDEYYYCSNKQGFYRATDGGPTYSGTSGWVNTDRFGWDAPITINPLNHNVLLAGSQYVYRSTNNGLTWAKVSTQDLSTNPLNSQLVYGCTTTLAISPADTNVYYAGTDDGKVWRSTNRGTNWTDIGATLPGRWVTRVTPDPLDPQVVYVTESGFSTDQSGSLVYRSTNQGSSWTNVSGNLPNMPANALIVDPTDTQTIYLGTDLGVWITRNTGATWYSLGAGMPLQAVVDLKLLGPTRTLYAFTHGRSAWSLALSALPTAVPQEPARTFALAAPWPNPAHDAVHLRLTLAQRAHAEVAIYDVVGRRISTLLSAAVDAGPHDFAWDRRDARGARAAAGVYFVRAVTGGATRTQRIVLAD